jgi:hypothetical protein
MLAAVFAALADFQAPAGHGDWFGTGLELLAAWLSRPAPAHEGTRLAT